MRVNDKQKQISKLLWDFQSLREEHVYKLCNCEEKDINFLIASKVIKRDNKNKCTFNKIRLYCWRVS